MKFNYRINNSGFLWNSIGGILNAMQSVVVLMVITRTAGLDAAGIYSIAFATGNLFMYLGNYGVRNYQVSDLQEQFSFADYRHHRYFTVLLMLILSLLFCACHQWSGSYSPEKTTVVFFFCILKCEDCIEEVFEGRLHQRGHLDLAGKMMTVRLLLSVGGMLAVLILGGSLLEAVVTAIILAFAAFFMMAAIYHDPLFASSQISGTVQCGAPKTRKEMHAAEASRVQLPRAGASKERISETGASKARIPETEASKVQIPKAETSRPRGQHIRFPGQTDTIRTSSCNASARSGVWQLMLICLPVCAANFLSFYLINAPKYAIDAYMDEAAQARYNFIAMPVFVIQLLTMFIYQPVMVRMTQHWQQDRHAFLQDFFRVVAWLAILSAAVLLGAYVLGIPVLSILYATDLADLKAEFMLLLSGSVFLAMNSFYCAVLTMMRLQNRIPLYYLAGTVLSLLLTPRLVAGSGITGAVIAFTTVMILVCLLLTIQFAIALVHAGHDH